MHSCFSGLGTAAAAAQPAQERTGTKNSMGVSFFLPPACPLNAGSRVHLLPADLRFRAEHRERAHLLPRAQVCARRVPGELTRLGLHMGTLVRPRRV